jgi:uncharacterized protein (TIGR02453 family)
MTRYFTADLFAFLAELSANNNRDWFEANKVRYEGAVRGPFLHFIADLAPQLETISPHLIADPRPVGGSFFRIHRDVRFSKDKSPYKTHAAARFRTSGEDAPGYYLSLSPDRCYAGGGLWRPESKTLGRIRDAIVEDPDAWRKATKGLEVEGEQLSRAPRGYDPDHPLLEDLKRKGFVTGFGLTAEEVCKTDFLERYVACCRRVAPLCAFLAHAAQAPW